MHALFHPLYQHALLLVDALWTAIINNSPLGKRRGPFTSGEEAFAAIQDALWDKIDEVTKDADTVVWFVGSNRQSSRGDALNAKHNLNGSVCYHPPRAAACPRSAFDVFP